MATTYQTTGIVIGRTNFGEADRIIRLLTPDHGKISAVAKGVRRIKSRSGGHLELLGEVNLMMATGRNLDVVTSARLMWYPHHLTADYEQLSLAFAMATAIDRTIQPGHPGDELYRMFAEALKSVDAGARAPLVELWFKLRLLTITGYRPELTACVTCGRHDQTAKYAFSADRGGIVCESDTTPLDLPMSHQAIKFWRILCDHPYSTAVLVADSDSLAKETLRSCDLFYEHHLGTQFKASWS